MNNGDTAWLLVSSALVMLMTPGLALFYGGLSRSKNVLGTIMQSFMMLGLISVQFVIIGYSLAFGPDHWGLIGDFSWIGLRHVSSSEANALYGPTVPHQAYMIFQLMFAVITPALITGAFAERAKFSTFLVFMLLWATIVYDPIAHWVWGSGGWLGIVPDADGSTHVKALDFAGGTVVHINAGIGALVAAFLYGKRHGFGRDPMEPHDITMVVIGASLLWFGWFGFNAGSAIASVNPDGSGSLATSAFVATHVATAAAALVWTLLSWIHTGKPSVVGAAAGAVAGLVAITPASGFVSPMSGLVIGAGAGALCYYAVRLRSKSGLDDSLDVVGVHGVGGTWGALATGIFCSLSVNAAGADGLIHGEISQLGKQLVAVVATMAYSGIVTFVILKVLDMVMGLRVSEDEEILGLDVSQHGERGYIMDGGGGYAGIAVTTNGSDQSMASRPAATASEATS